MTRLRAGIVRLLAPFRRGRIDAALTDEISSHLDHLEQEHRARGASRQSAQEAARRDFGNVQRLKDAYWDQYGVPWMRDAAQDVRYATRALKRTPAFTVAAAATLAIGIGVNSTVFSAVNALLLQPLPYDDSDRLVRIIENLSAEESMTGAPERTSTMAPDVFAQWRTQTRTLSHMALRRQMSMTLAIPGQAIRLTGLQVSSPLMPMLRVAPLLGRVFEIQEEKPGSDKVVILSYGMWLTYFGGDSTIIGRPISLDDTSYTVVGVMPRGFAFPDASTNLWTPLALTTEPGQFLRLEVTARLADGVSMDAAQTEADTLVQDLLGIPTEAGRRRIEIVSFQDELTAPIRSALVVFLFAATLVFLIACVNVANLFLARAMVRQREISVRMALGAGRGRVLRQLLAESLLVAFLGGFIGCALALAGSRLMATLGQGLGRLDLTRMGVASDVIPRLNEIGLSVGVVLYALVITVMAGIFFGLSPIRRLRQQPLVHGLRTQPGLTRFSVSSPSAQMILIITQVAFTTILLIGGVLLIRSFMNLMSVDPGYSAENIVTFQLPQPRLPWTSENYRANLAAQRQEIARADIVLTRLKSTPGVQATAFTAALPMVQTGFILQLKPTLQAPMRAIPGGKLLLVSRDYFDVMRIRMVAGRGFVEADRSRQQGTFVINRALAKSYFGNENPIGKVVYPWGRFSGEIVGISDDVHQSSLDTAPEPQLFLTVGQTNEYLPIQDPGGLYFAVRTETDAAAIVPHIRSIVRQIDPRIPLHNVATMNQIVANAVTTPRGYAVASGLFAVVATALASIGLFGLLSYFVNERTREIGVRMALGARRREVLVLVVRKGLALTSAGVLLGLVGGAGLTRFLERMLFGLTPLDLGTFIAVPVLFAVIAAIACWIPAHRATKLDPLMALRYE